MKDNQFFLEHIIESIDNIQDFIKGINRDNFAKNKIINSAVLRQLEIIGEAVKNLPIEFTTEYPHIDWSGFAGLRDKIIHHYFGVDHEKVWKIIQEELPTLKKDTIEIIKNSEK